MSDSIGSDVGLAVLRDDVAALKRDLAGLIEHLKAGAATGAHDAAEHLDAEIRDGASRLYRGIAAGGEKSAKALGGQIGEHPLLALLVALGVGYVGGRMLSR